MLLVAQFYSDTQIVDITRGVLEQLVHSTINYVHGIQLLFDKPLGNHTCLNITRPALFRQYFGRESISNNDQNNVAMRYTY